MEVSLSALIGSAAGCIGLYSFVPQVIKCCRTGDVAAISLRMFAVRTFGLLLWTLYGFALGSLPCWSSAPLAWCCAWSSWS
ncbi:SemiSWEET family sugar transporter [Microvirga yunnanensis]|uniref:SemiSWEET family sugar transporter n=1 Tax=Microvirga yunnanensis TaxID=2953740 RepID=UPI0021C65444|nr:MULTISPECIES: PQ-loop domain-containing transporter [unclassified Microvirga]